MTNLPLQDAPSNPVSTMLSSYLFLGDPALAHPVPLSYLFAGDPLTEHLQSGIPPIPCHHHMILICSDPGN